MCKTIANNQAILCVYAFKIFERNSALDCTIKLHLQKTLETNAPGW